jgi:hypothetical protein
MAVCQSGYAGIEPGLDAVGDQAALPADRAVPGWFA